MSLGYCGGCRKISEDETFALYEYFSCDLSDGEKIFDGLILIKKNSLVEPERREKFRRMPNGRRQSFTKIILRDVPIDELIASGDVQIENCSRAWKFLPNGVDYVAVTLCRKIFTAYQCEGALPNKCGWLV